MAAGFNTTYQPQYQPQNYSQGYAMPQPAVQPQPQAQTYTQTYTQNPMPAQYQPQTQQTGQSYPQNYYLPQTPGIVNYVTPPQNIPSPQGQPQALSNIPYEQNPLNMNTGFSPAPGTQNGLNGAMNVQMPAPAIQNGQGQGSAMNAQAPVEQPFMDIGVVDAPENFSKTPILDDLNRRGQTTERETPPKLRGKKTFTLGNVSAACSVGALGIILTMGLCKILKLIKHK